MKQRFRVISDPNKTSFSEMNNRADIDGLRGLAVLFVLLYHFFPKIYPAGFLGVDIFFCISGFLITSLIIRQHQHGKFSFLDFYQRRIRRIFPALTLVLISAFGLGWILLDAEEFTGLCKSLFSAAVMTANFKAAGDVQYFSMARDVQPLLHLWSISIEEQFYLLWPFLLVLALRRKWPVGILTMALVVVFFFWSLQSSIHDPRRFYFFTQARIWEILFGCFVAIIKSTDQFSSLKRILEDKKRWLSYSGLGLLLFTLGLVLRLENFSIAWAFVPVLGTALLLLADASGFQSSILSCRWLRGLGLISYSLYLWHWMVFSFARISLGEFPNLKIRFVLIGLSLMLAYLSYRFVETPARRVVNLKVISVFAILLLLTGLLGMLGQRYKGFENRAAAQFFQSTTIRYVLFRKTACPRVSEEQKNFFCYSDNLSQSNAAIIGDSHAADKYVGLSEQESSYRWTWLGYDSCPPSLGFVTDDPDTDCTGRFESVARFLGQQKQLRLVVLSYFGYYYQGKPTREQIESFRQGLEKMITILEEQKKKIVLVVDRPMLQNEPRDCFRSGKLEGCERPFFEVRKLMTPNMEMAIAIKERHPSVEIYNPIGFFCPEMKCRYRIGHQFIFGDLHHLTLEGSRLYAQDFLAWLKKTFH